MKKRLSFIAVCIISIIFVIYRSSYPTPEQGGKLKVTTWDALGYYMYLPSALIYDDATELKWFAEIDSTYQLSGGTMYQAHKHTNGNYVFKYLGGVSIMQLPFFLGAHAYANMTDYKADGFSAPYQYAVAYGALLYFILALFLLRHILLRYYDDRVVAITLLLLTLASNLIQYITIDSAQSHAYIFPLYVLVLYTTIKWHEAPSYKWAALTGVIIGLATISRPTEAIMLFIPLLWNTHTREAKSEKWQLVKAHLKHVYVAALFGLIGVLPQLIYWKIASGSFIYDVGSKWFFLNPWFRVLFGFENGWFIYTPVTILFVLGFFFIRKFPFRRSVIVFCLLNIWIIIAWADWKYGATYSTRALTQSYPVFALALGGFVSRFDTSKWRYAVYAAGAYLIFVNLFQIKQYNNGILHYREMNRLYYGHIYLNNNPTPLDMSLLDTDEFLKNPEDYHQRVLLSSEQSLQLLNTPEQHAVIGTTTVTAQPGTWIKVEAEIKAEQGFTASYLKARIHSKSSKKETGVRLPNAITKAGQINPYTFFMKVPDSKTEHQLDVFIYSWENFSGTVKSFKVTEFTPKNR